MLEVANHVNKVFHFVSLLVLGAVMLKKNANEHIRKCDTEYIVLQHFLCSFTVL